jgi:hypothetical protein
LPESCKHGAARREVNPMDVINFQLMKHPINWLTVLLMVFIFGMAVHLGLRFWQNSD